MSKAKFKVGDKVIILDGRNIENYTCGWCTADKIGKTLTVEHVEKFGDGRIGYRMKEDSCCFDERGLKPQNKCIVIYRKGQEVIALDKVTGKKAVAKCSPDDEFDFNIGSKLAFERLLGVEQPQYKEVKRKAKKGECVKIVKPHTTSGAYGKDDILKVIETDYCGVYCVGAKITLESGYYVSDTEYVVLEGYEPPKQEKNVAFRFLCIEDNIGWLTKGKVYEAIDGRITYDNGYTGRCNEKFATWQKKNGNMASKVVELKEGEDPDEIMKQYTFFNGKAVCTSFSLEGYTYGKIYEFKDGYCTDDDGMKRPMVFGGYKELPDCFVAVVE